MFPKSKQIMTLSGGLFLCILSSYTLSAEAPATRFGPPDPAPSPAAVINMVNNCYSCHGSDGRSPGAIPSITNMTPQQALAVLMDFKSGARPSTVMSRHTKGYTDAELEAIANYIGTTLK